MKAAQAERPNYWCMGKGSGKGAGVGCQVFLDKPQETVMWEDFAKCVKAIRKGEAPAQRWPQESLLTQRVLNAFLDSALQDSAVVRLS